MNIIQRKERIGKILEAIHKDGTRPLAKIAKESGVPVTTVFNYMEKLRKKGKVRYVGWVVTDDIS